MNDNICYHMVTKINQFYSILTNADDKCKQMLFNVILTNLINKLGLSSAKLSRAKFGCLEVIFEVVSKDNFK